MIKHWEHTEVVSEDVYKNFVAMGSSITPSVELPCNTGVFIECKTGGKRLEGIFDAKFGGIRP